MAGALPTHMPVLIAAVQALMVPPIGLNGPILERDGTVAAAQYQDFMAALVEQCGAIG